MNRPTHPVRRQTGLALISWAGLLLAAGDAVLARADETGLVTVRGTIVDDESGAILPARLYVSSADGTWYFARSSEPTGSSVQYDVARSPTSLERHVTLSAHPFEVDLPPGRYTLRAERGKEFFPAETIIDVSERPREVELRLRRWIDMAERGWYSGETHVHRTLADLPNVMLAEDLNVALPLSWWVREADVPPLQADDSVDVIPSSLIVVDETHVIWPMNTEYEIFTVRGVTHTLGAVFVLNHRERLRPSAPPVGPIAAAAREQHALLDLDKHSWPWSLMLVPIMQIDLFELANNHVWQTEFFFRQWTTDIQPTDWEIETDAFGWTESGWLDFGFKTYYALLNCGFPLRPTAGTASGVHPVPLGYGRVYVPIEGEFSYEQWLSQLDQGHSFVTTGPMLFVQVDGRPPGARWQASPGATIAVDISAESSLPLSRIEVLVNGDVVRTIQPENRPRDRGGYLTQAEAEITLDGSSWLAVRCFELTPAGRERFAHTSPVHVELPGRPLRPRLREVNYFIQRMETEIERNRSLLTADELAEYEAARQHYQSLRERAVE